MIHYITGGLAIGPKGKLTLEQSRGDRFGMALSTVCLVHCLAIPVILAMLPVLVLEGLPFWARDNAWFHAALIVPVAVVSGPILLRSARDRPMISILGVLGFVALATALFAPGELAERIMTVSGAGMIFVAHFLNLKATIKASHT